MTKAKAQAELAERKRRIRAATVDRDGYSCANTFRASDVQCLVSHVDFLLSELGRAWDEGWETGRNYESADLRGDPGDELPFTSEANPYRTTTE